MQAAMRELREEVRLDVPERDISFVAEYRQPWAWHYDHLFAVILDREEAPRRMSAEIRSVQWFSLSDQPPPLTASAREALRRLPRGFF